MTSKLSVLKRAGEAVAAVASAFGGFLLNVAPQEGTLPHFAPGFAAAISAIIFLAISLLAELLIGRKRYKMLFLAISIPLMSATAITGLRYQDYFFKHTIPSPLNATDRMVISDQMTDWGLEHYKNDKSLAEYLEDDGGFSAKTRDRNWTRSSLADTILHINNLYILLSVLLSASIFCLLEGLVPSTVEASESKPNKDEDEAESGGEHGDDVTDRQVRAPSPHSGPPSESQSARSDAADRVDADRL